MNFETNGYSDDYFDTTHHTNKQDITKVVIGALAGAAVGSLVAGAFTEKGEEIRHKVGKKGKKVADNFRHKVSDISHSVTDKIQSAKESAADLLQKGKQKVGIKSKTPTYGINTAYAGNTAYTVNNGDFDYDETNGTGKKVVAGALIASVAGLVIWGLATEKGKKTTKSLVNKSKDLAGDLKEKASHLKEVVVDVYESAREGANELIEQEKQRTILEEQRMGLTGAAPTTYSTTGVGGTGGVTGAGGSTAGNGTSPNPAL